MDVPDGSIVVGGGLTSIDVGGFGRCLRDARLLSTLGRQTSGKRLEVRSVSRKTAAGDPHPTLTILWPARVFAR